MKKLFLFLLVSSLAFAQGGIHNGIALKSTGVPASGASVRVCTSTATGTPCSPLAAIYSDAALANPIVGSVTTADANGNYHYYSTAGLYEEQVTVGTSTFTSIIQITTDLTNVVLSSVTQFELNSVLTTDYTNPYRIYLGWNPAANSSQYQFGLTVEGVTQSANNKTKAGQQVGSYGSWSDFGTGNSTLLAGGAFEAFNSGSATALEVVGVSANADNGGVAAGHPVQTPTNNGSATHVRGVHATVTNRSSGTITNAVNFFSHGCLNTGGGTITNCYGYYGSDVTAGVNNWQAYFGAGKTQFKDVVQFDAYAAFGTTNDKTSSFVNLAPQGIQTGTTQWGMKVFPLFNSLATVFGVGVYGRADTQNASFTMNQNASFYASNPTKGAASTINTLYGLFVDDMTAGGTNYSIYTTGSAPAQFGGKAIAIGGVQPASTGTAITWFQKATHASLDLASVATAACTSETTETITGAALADSCNVASSTALETGGFFRCAVTATDTVKWQLCNLSGGAIDRASDTYTIRVTR